MSHLTPGAAITASDKSATETDLIGVWLGAPAQTCRSARPGSPSPITDLSGERHQRDHLNGCCIGGSTPTSSRRCDRHTTADLCTEGAPGGGVASASAHPYGDGNGQAGIHSGKNDHRPGPQ